MLLDGKNMKKLLTILLATLALFGCVVVVQDTTYVQPQPHVQICRWVDIPVYGHADIYRDRDTTVRIKQTAFVDRQWRCN